MKVSSMRGQERGCKGWATVYVSWRLRNAFVCSGNRTRSACPATREGRHMRKDPPESAG